jgi:hypothetical protein
MHTKKTKVEKKAIRGFLREISNRVLLVSKPDLPLTFILI